MPRFLNLEIRWIAMFTPSVHRYVARMPTDFGGLPDLMTWKSAGLPCFVMVFPSTSIDTI